MTSPLSRLLGVLALPALLGGCEAGSPDAALPVRSALLITLDTTRADALGPYGGRPGLTPALERLAREALLYEQARTVAPITLPAHASMLTGLYPPRHSVRDNSLNPLPEAAVTLAEQARRQGLRTAAFVAAVVLDGAFGLNQGFEVYRSPPRLLGGNATAEIRSQAAPVVVREMVAWLRELDRSERFFAWVHLFDPHFPYEPPPPWLERAGGNAYLGEVAAADDAVGWLLQTLRLAHRLDETLVVVVADHGEALGDHGEASHGVYTYDSTLRVPLLVRYPDGWRAGERSREVVSVVDIHPTLVEALGLAEPAALGQAEPEGPAGSAPLDGLSLYRRPVPEGRGVYFESYYGHLNYGFAPLVGWLGADGIKYVHGSSAELHDVFRDPQEEHALGGEGPDPAPHREAAARVAGTPGLRAERSVDPALVSQLGALGYATAGASAGQSLPDPFSAGDLPDPRERKQEVARLNEALMAGEAQLEQTIASLHALLREHPDNPGALEFLAAGLVATQRCEEALGALERLAALGRLRATSHVNFGACLTRLGRDVEAIPHFERALELDRHNVEALYNLAAALMRLGQKERAAEVERRLQALHPQRGRLRPAAPAEGHP